MSRDTFDPYIYALERKLQQTYNPPWLREKLPPAHNLVTELCDKMASQLRAYGQEQTEANLKALVITVKQLDALGFHPSIVGERKIAIGIVVIRADVWSTILKQKEAENVSSPPNAV